MKIYDIGDAEDVAEGVAMGTTVLTASTTTATVKKAGKAVELTDESVLSGYGDPVGETAKQLTMSIASKVDSDCYDALAGAPLTYDGTAAKIGYDGVVDAAAVFESEADETEVGLLYIHPDQEATIRKDADFKDKNKYGLDVVMTGTIGSIAGYQVVKSKRVKLVKYAKDNTNGTITIVADNVTETTTDKHLATIVPNCIDKLVVGDKVAAVATNFYACPLIITGVADPNEDPAADANDNAAPALTIYMKRDVEMEDDRDILAKTTVLSADEHYVAVRSNDSKVVLAKFKA